MNAKRVPVLMYHRVGDSRNNLERKYCVSPTRFASHMHTLARAGWRALPIDRFFAWLEGRDVMPERSFMLTFDDGFLGVHEHAAPVLAALRWPATVFLVTQLIGKRDHFNEVRHPGSATYPLLGVNHIRELLGQGFRFHSHTRTHADLPTLDDSTLHDELAGARNDLHDLLGESVHYLAYPYGHYDDRVLRAVQDAGYRAAFSVQPGFNRTNVNRLLIRRLDVFGTDTPPMLLRKIRLGSNDGSLSAMARYSLDRIAARLGHGR